MSGFGGEVLPASHDQRFYALLHAIEKGECSRSKALLELFSKQLSRLISVILDDCVLYCGSTQREKVCSVERKSLAHSLKD